MKEQCNVFTAMYNQHRMLNQVKSPAQLLVRISTRYNLSH